MLAWLPLIMTVAMWGWLVMGVPIGTEETLTEWLAAIAAITSVLAFSVVGSYLAYRLPRNPVGWILAGFGFWFTLGIVLEDAVDYGRVSGSMIEWFAWTMSWTWVVSGSLVAIYLPIWFPDGRLPSRAWRWVPWIAAAAVATIFVANAFSIEATAPVRNPMGLPDLTELLELVGLIGFLVFAVCIIAAAASVVSRFRRSRGIARRQMLLFVVSAAIVAVGLGASYTLYELDRPDAANAAVSLVSLMVPAAVGMAVLRYRLYDLGRIVKRTATYTVLAVVLLGVYLAGVLALQSFLDADDSLSVAASTLAAAAVFGPARRRIQAFIDRRFDRARYDAGKVVDAFSSRLNQQVDLDGLNRDVAAVVASTLRPTAVSVWIRPS
jgi:hypothetical protein